MPVPRQLREDEESDILDDLDNDTDAWQSGYDTGREEILDNVNTILGPLGPGDGGTEVRIMEALEALVGRSL